MAIEFPSDTRRHAPLYMLAELSQAIDDSTPMPRRIAIILKWRAFIEAATGQKIDTMGVDMRDLTPDKVRELAIELAKIAAKLVVTGFTTTT